MSITEASPLGGRDEPVVTVTEVARAKLIELRDAEPEGDALGVRIEVVSDQGSDFTYDLSFQVLAQADLTDVIHNEGGLRVIVPAKDVVNLEGAVLDHEAGGLVLRNPNRPKPLRLDRLVRDDDLSAQVEAVIDQEVNPMLDAHGGFVTFAGHDDEGRVFLTMGGGCHGCAMSRMTMLQGVERIVKDAVPGVTHVIDITDHTVGQNPYYR